MASRSVWQFFVLKIIRLANAATQANQSRELPLGERVKISKFLSLPYIEGNLFFPSLIHSLCWAYVTGWCLISLFELGIGQGKGKDSLQSQKGWPSRHYVKYEITLFAHDNKMEQNIQSKIMYTYVLTG